MTTYYLSPSGSDANSGSLAAPWATFVHADGVIVAGDTVRALPGTYTFTGTSTDFDDLDTHPNGTSGAHITWISDTPGAAKLVSSGSVGGGAYVLWRAKGNYTDIIGFEMYATSANVNMSYLLAVEGSNCTVQNCIAHDAQLGVCSSGQGGAGIYVGNATYSNTNVSVLNCKAYNIGPSGCIYNHGIYFTIQGGSISNNICYGNSGTGLHLNHNAGSVTIANNLCFNNGASGTSSAGMHLHITGTDGQTSLHDLLVINNICFNNLGQAGIWCNAGDFGTTSNNYNNNNCFGNQTAQLSVAVGTFSGNITVDPLFVNYLANGSGNYHLAAGSPCIDTGYATGAPTTDYDGIARPQGSGIDIGPYEYASFAPLAISIGGPSAVPCLIESLSFDEKIDDPAAATFDVPDSVGYALSQYQAIQVTDVQVSRLLYSGFVETIDDQAFPGNTGIRMRTLTCTDNRWRGEKRIWTGQEFDGWTAGDAVAKMHQAVLASEGVIAAYAMRHDFDTTTFGQGTLAGTVALGDTLTLASAGTDYTRTDAVTADFNTGTLTQVAAASNALALTSYKAIKYSGSAGANLDNNNLYAYRKIWAGSYTLVASDKIYVDVWIDSRSPEIKVGIDMLFGDNTWLHDFPTDFQDQYVIPLVATTDLKGWADDQWMKRVCIVPASRAGKVVKAIYVDIEGEKGGDYTAYFKNVKITDSTGATVRVSAFAGADTTMHANVPASSNGYFNLKAAVTTVYEHDGNRVAPSRDITSVGIVRGSMLSWVEIDAAQPSGASSQYLSQVMVEASIDGGATYQQCTNHAPIPGLIVGMNTSGRGVIIRQTLAVGGPNPELTPRLDTCTFSVYSAAAATKTDFVDIDNDQTSLGTGTLSNATSYADGLYTTGSYRNWDDLSVASQTLFGASGAGSPEMSVAEKYLFLRTDTGLDEKARFDFAGTWQNFILEIDIHLLDTSDCNYGVVYRETVWNTTNDTYAYNAHITPTAVRLTRGSNSGTGAFTSIASVAVTLTSGAWYRMKVAANGSNHQIFLNDVQFINATDATFSAAGNVGVRLWNNSGTRHSGHFDNFGIVGYEADLISVSSRTTSAIALSGIVGDSRVNWQESTPSSSSMLVESTLNNGTLWETCTNGGQIPQLVSGYNAAGKSLKFRFTMTNQAVNLPSMLLGYSAFVIGQYSASGTRVSPVLALDNAGTIGSSSVTWQATQPAGTGVAVATSPDNSTYTGIAASGNPVAGLVAQGGMIADDFDVNTAANYTATFWSGGVAPVFSVDTANSRMRVTSGTSGIILWNTSQFPVATDVYLELISNQSDAGGLVWRYTSVDNCYYATYRDTSAGTNPNTVAVRKRVAATDTQILAPTTLPVTFTRSTYHTLKVTMAGSLITVYFDGLQVAQFTDSSLTSAGQVGIRQNSATESDWYSLRAQALGASATGQNVYSKLTLTSTDPTVKPVVSGLVVSVRSPDIMTGALLPATQYAAQKISANIADAASRSKMYWTIDKNLRLMMKDRAYSPAPWPLYSTDPLYLGTSNPPRLVRRSPLYRNRQYVTGAIDLQTLPAEGKVGDGTTQSWTLAYPVDSITSITLDGNPQTWGVQGVDSGKNFYYQPGQNTLSADSTLFPEQGAQIAITYVGRVPYTSKRESTAQQALLRQYDGTTGIVEASEDCGGLSAAAADAIAQARIDERALLAVEWSYSTRRTGLAPGHFQTLFVPEHGLNDIDVLITGIHTNVWEDTNGTIQYFYDVSTTSGANIGVWQRIFALAA